MVVNGEQLHYMKLCMHWAFGTNNNDQTEMTMLPLINTIQQWMRIRSTSILVQQYSHGSHRDLDMILIQLCIIPPTQHRSVGQIVP
jgi:hypothetical protein